jgi:hypothetical protein
MHRLNMLALSVVVALFLLVGCGGSKPISGSYVAKGDRFASLLQLTEAKDKSLKGSLIEAQVLEDGKVRRTRAGVHGVVDGSSITIMVRGGLLGGERSLSGSVSGDAIDLALPADSKASATSYHAVKADVSAFEAALKELSARAAAVGEERKAQERRLSEESTSRQKADQIDGRVSRLAGDLRGFAAEQAKLPERVKAVGAAYDLAIDQGRRLVQRQRELLKVSTNAGRGEAHVVHVDLSRAIEDIRRMGVGVDQEASSIQKAIVDLDRRILEAQSACPPSRRRGGVYAGAISCEMLTTAITSYQAQKPAISASLSTAKDLRAAGDGASKEIRHESNAQTRDSKAG